MSDRSYEQRLPFLLENPYPFRLAGIVLTVLGVTEIARLLYCLETGLEYGSIAYLILIPGLILLTGSAKAAWCIRWVCLFVAITALVLVLLTPFWMPLHQLITDYQSAPAVMLAYIGYTLARIALLLWVYLKLDSRDALRRYQEVSMSVRMPITAIQAGMMCGIALCWSLLLSEGEEGISTSGMQNRFEYGASYIILTNQGVDKSLFASPDRPRNTPDRDDADPD